MKLVLAWSLIAFASAACAQSSVTDATGRTIRVPENIRKVYAAGPPASVFVLALAPDKLAGWARALRPDEIALLPPSVTLLPVLGRLTGRGSTANVEALMAAKPDLVVDIGSISPTYVSLAERVQQTTGIPYLLFDGRLEDTPRLLRELGRAIGASAEGEALASSIEASLSSIASRVAGIPEERRPRVFYARGPNGLATAPRGSLQSEVLDLAGARNVAERPPGFPGNLFSVSLEQVLLWQPDVIVTIDAEFPRAVRSRPEWQAVPAVRNNRIYVAPELPFGWDRRAARAQSRARARVARAHPASDRVPGAARTAHRRLPSPVLSPDAERRAGRGAASRCWPSSLMTLQRRYAVTLSVALAGTLSLAFLAVTLGRFPIHAHDLVSVLLREDAVLGAPAAQVVWSVRLPRIVGALLIGMALASAGAAFQQMFRNPLVAPDTLGVSAGAALGAVGGIFLGLSVVAIQALAFAGGLIAVSLVLLVASRMRALDPLVTLILTGIVVAGLIGAGISLLKYLADPYNQLPAITFWLLGSLASLGPQDIAVAALPMVVAVAALWLVRWKVNLLTLDDDEAEALGVPVAALRDYVICAATLATAAAVAVSGIIGWIGLVVPHCARLLVGPDFRRLLPVSAVLGAAFMLAVDTLGRTIAVIEIPPGVLTALVGSPVFVYLLARVRRAD